MIILRIEGGLGNIMFQYALGRHLSLINHTSLKFDVESCWVNPLGDYSLSLEAFHINIHDNLATSSEIKHFKRYQRKTGLWAPLYNRLVADETRYIQEYAPHFQPKVLSSANEIYLHGWWQNERYFIDSRKTLLDDFTVRTSLEGKNLKVAEHIQTSGSVAIHVRRADYVTNQKTKQYHGELTHDYYEQALDRITAFIPQPTLFIFSDDIPWVKKYLPFPFETIHVDWNSNLPHEDMRLMSLCQHHIVANSSFSWWGAWLSRNPNQIVVAPNRWTQDPRDLNERVPTRWIRI